jgi:hypothetical protein
MKDALKTATALLCRVLQPRIFHAFKQTHIPLKRLNKLNKRNVP